jgi:hypothetical protein
VRRLLPLVLLFALASTATAATIRGTARGDFIQTAFNGSKDSVTCGRGTDVVSADASDRIAADCEIVSRRLSVDPYSNPDSQHETAVEPDDVAFGSTVVAAFQLGRRDGGAAANIGTAVSHDGGRTWQRSVLPAVTVNGGGPETAASDPTVAYDAVHDVWLVGTLTIHRGGSDVMVARSSDGLHWSAPVVAAEAPTLDKDWLVCDNGAASQFRGRCYAAYTDDDNNLTISQSSDDGGLTWSAPVHAAGFLVGTQPVVQPNGALTVVAGNYMGQDSLHGSIVALHSTDGGATWRQSTISALQSAANDPMRAISLPSVDVDSTGTIYAVWHDCRFRPDCTANDIVLSTSTDGATWSAPTRVTTGPSSFIPGLGADPTTPGRLGLVYAYYDPQQSLNIAFTQSRDGGKTWTRAQRLDALPMKTSWLARADGGRMVGDYFSTAFSAGRVVPVYALAAAPAKGRFREGIFAASLKPVG